MGAVATMSIAILTRYTILIAISSRTKVMATFQVRHGFWLIGLQCELFWLGTAILVALSEALSGCLVFFLGGGWPIGCHFMDAYCIDLGGCPIWVDVHHMRVWMSPPSMSVFQSLMTFSLVVVVDNRVRRVASHGVPCLEYLQHLCYWWLCPQINSVWLLQSTCKLNKFVDLVNMIMLAYDCEFFAWFRKDSDICINTMLLISPFFMVLDCIHPMVAMDWCFVLSYPGLSHYTLLSTLKQPLLFQTWIW